MVEWRAVVGFEGAYEVSNAGEVRSLARVVLRSNGSPNTVRPRLLKQSISKTGYATVSLSQPGAPSVTHNVHVLVAMAFLEPQPAEGKWHVDHIDFDRTNNMADNLRWLSAEENSHRYERDHGTNTPDGERPGTDLAWGFESDEEW